MFKKCLSITLAVLITLSIFFIVPFFVSAKELDVVATGATIIDYGKTGTCNWTLDDEGVLTISGDGNMENYYYTHFAAPWGTNIVDVIIEDGVLNIGDYAFYECTNLKNISISKSVLSIGRGAFDGCGCLMDLSIPDSIKNIGVNALSGTGWYKNQPDGLVYAGKIAYRYKGDCPEAITINAGTLGIADNAFSFLGSLKSIIIPNGLLTIGEKAFYNSSNLSEITFPDCLIDIGNDAFFGTVWYNERPDGLVYAGKTAYCVKGNCPERIDIKQGTLRIEDYALKNSNSLKVISIPDSVKKIGNEAFYNCKKLNSINIPNSVMSIGISAFAKCESLVSISIPDSVTWVSSNLFSDCTSLKNVKLSNNIISICYRMFYNCSSLTGLTIPDSVTSINDQAFLYCKSLNNLNIPNSVSRIGNAAFEYCESLENITIPDSVVDIGLDAFSDTYWYDNQPEGLVYAGKVAYHYKGNCPESISIKAGTSAIAGNAFYSCKNLKKILIPNSVIILGNQAFSSCENLSNLVLPTYVECIGRSAFANCKSLKHIAVPDFVTTIDSYTFYGCTNLNGVTFSRNISEIKKNAFSECPQLKNVFFDGTQSDWNAISIDNSNECNSALLSGEIHFLQSTEDDTGILIGDADCDGEITIIDATVIQRYLADFPIYSYNEIASDVNRDGVININDVTLVQCFIAMFPTQAVGIGEVIQSVDTDKDGLTDYIENVIRTDLNKPDTDGDRLTDYQEVILGTNPLIADNYDESLDSDSDGITDIDETSIYFTDPFSPDSDNDGLTDNEEINFYYTNALSSDTDGDTLNDKFEIKHGLDPNKASTDGITLDADVTFDQSISEDSISSQVKTEDNVAVPEISGEAKGDLSDSLYIAEAGDEIIGENRSVIGKAIEVSTESEDYDVNGLTLSFDVSRYKDLGGDTEALTICKINEDGEFDLVESNVSNNSISCIMDTEGTYCVVNIDDFLNRMGINIYDIYNDTELVPVGAESWEAPSGAGISGQADIVFAIDSTGSMQDKINAVERNVKYFARKLKSDYNVMVNYALIDFRDLEEDGYDSTKLLKNGSSNWYSNTTSFANKIDTICADGGGDDPECDIDALETARRLDFRESSHKFVVLITDADYKELNRYGISSMEEEAYLLSQKGIITSVVTTNSLKSSYQVLLDKTGGIFANINSDFGSVLLQLADMIGENTGSDKWAILKHGYTYIELPENRDGDYDDDGLSDAYELGDKETLDLTTFIKLRLAIAGVPFDKYLGKTSVEVYNARSNPVKSDTDSDGIADGKDTAPWTKGLKNGIVGGLRICSYSSGPSSAVSTSGHAYVVYTSFVNEDLNLYGMLVDSKENLATCTRMDSPSYHNIHMNSDDFISIGAWGGSVPDNQKGTWINDERIRFDNNAPAGQYSLVAYISNSQVQKFSNLTKENSSWNPLNNCSVFAKTFWNEVTEDNLSAEGYIFTGNGLIIINNPSSLSYNILQRNDYQKGGKQSVDWPNHSGGGGGGGGGGGW